MLAKPSSSTRIRQRLPFPVTDSASTHKRAAISPVSAWRTSTRAPLAPRSLLFSLILASCACAFAGVRVFCCRVYVSLLLREKSCARGQMASPQRSKMRLDLAIIALVLVAQRTCFVGSRGDIGGITAADGAAGGVWIGVHVGAACGSWAIR